MKELWLTYTDADGSRRRVAIERSEFVIGRHSDCDLAIPDSRLSRRHARLVRTNGSLTLEDLGSSNGTDVNDEPVFEPVEIRSGDRISFGGLEAIAEISEETRASGVPAPAAVPSKAEVPNQLAKTKLLETESSGRGIPVWAIFVAPVLAAVLVVVAGIAVFLVMRGPTDVSATGIDQDDPIVTDDPVGNKSGNVKDDPDPTPSNRSSADDPPAGQDPIGTTPTPANLTETAKVEINAAAFLRKIAQNNPKAFLTGEQAKRVGAKVKQLGSSSGLAENLNSAKKNGAQIKTIAAAKNLKPQMLAIAAIAKLGGNRGDVVGTATSMADVLDKLSVHLGNELADDCLLTIAAYDQGAAGETMKMRNMLQELANKSSESSRTIRTIWFLEKEKKITPAQFDFALYFLAVGTIAQNPKDFGVNAEALDI